jgi:hypothetical protein
MYYLILLVTLALLSACARSQRPPRDHDDWRTRPADGPDTSQVVYFEDGEWRTNFGPVPPGYDLRQPPQQ